MCIPLTEKTKNNDFSSEICDAVERTLSYPEPNAEDHPALEQELKDDNN